MPHVKVAQRIASLKTTYEKIPSRLFGPQTTLFEANPPFGLKSRVQFLLLQQPSKGKSPTNPKARPSQTVSMSESSVRVLTTPTADTPGTCLFLHHDNRRYIFGNVAEGTQRLMVQRKVSLAKAEHLFLTGPVSWQNAGGVLGMVLTIADVVKEGRTSRGVAAGKKKKNPGALETMAQLNMHGGENLTHLLATARRFIFRKGLPLNTHEIRTDPRAMDKANSEPDWQDSNIMVWNVPLFADERPRPQSRKRSHDEMDPQPEVPDTEQEHTSQQVVDAILKNMFDSDWNFDALVETTLHRVKLPAKLFVRDSKGTLKPYSGPLPGTAAHVPDVPVLVRRPWPATLIQALPRTRPAQQSMCYIVKNHSRRGKFNKELANRYGVKPVDCRRLTQGESVVGKTGTTVTPDMVIGATIQGQGFAIVEIPDSSYIDAFLARREWTDGQIMCGIAVIFWVLGAGVIKDSRILEFMRNHTSFKHMVSSQDTCPNQLALSSPAEKQVMLHRIDPKRFHIQQFSNINSPEKNPSGSSIDSSGKDAPITENTTMQEDASLDSSASAQHNSTSVQGQSANSLPTQRVAHDQPFEGARAGLAVRLAPGVVFEHDKIFPFVDFKTALEQLDEDTLRLADEARTRVSEPSFLKSMEAADWDIPNRDAEIIPLGTGSALPSKYRNVSATLVRVPGSGSYLFDCGENTLGQIRRLFGMQGADEILRDLRVIWISHLHADHHLGTASVIRAWRDARATTPDTATHLAVASHPNMLDWLREYADVENYGYDQLRLIPLITPDHAVDEPVAPIVFSPDDTQRFGLSRIDAARVDHCHGAMATVFSWPSGLKVAYSGDCRPSKAFVKIGQGATLLIHEATFEDHLTGEAAAKKHCTMAEALDVGRRMGARRVLLTHFSQRYPKIPVFDVQQHGGDRENGLDRSKKDMVVLMAFDQMRVRLGEFKEAAEFLPALQSLFAQGGEGVEDDKAIMEGEVARLAEEKAEVIDVKLMAVEAADAGGGKEAVEAV